MLVTNSTCGRNDGNYWSTCRVRFNFRWLIRFFKNEYRFAFKPTLYTGFFVHKTNWFGYLLLSWHKVKTSVSLIFLSDVNSTFNDVDDVISDVNDKIYNEKKSPSGMGCPFIILCSFRALWGLHDLFTGIFSASFKFPPILLASFDLLLFQCTHCYVIVVWKE